MHVQTPIICINLFTAHYLGPTSSNILQNFKAKKNIVGYIERVRIQNVRQTFSRRVVIFVRIQCGHFLNYLFQLADDPKGFQEHSGLAEFSQP